MIKRVNPCMYLMLFAGVCCLLHIGRAWAEPTLPLAPFAEASLDEWQEHSFKGNTSYAIASEDGVRVLSGATKGEASMLYKTYDISLKKTPLLSWHWKVANVFSGNDEQSRSGDDYPARLYVVHRYGFLPWQTYAINYVWASQTPKGQIWNNPYSSKSKMIAMQSGNELVGSWQAEARNVANDFDTLFGVKVDALDGIAIMVDADNTGQAAAALFGEIKFSSD